MESRKPKRLEDLPKLIVTGVRRGATSDTGYTRFEIEGSFDRAVDQINPHWFWLLFGEAQCLCATLESLDPETNDAIVTCDEQSEPTVLGQGLVYLSPYWQAFHVWMVLDPGWGWQRRQLTGIDAVAEDYESNEISIVDGREVKIWTKLVPSGGGTGQSRHYPATDQSVPIRSGTRLIPLGWGHEHCELCRAHIDAGEFGYCDPGERWVCEECHEKYVERHDLAFVDEL